MKVSLRSVCVLSCVVGSPLWRRVQRGLHFSVALLLLTAISIPGCLKRKAVLLDGGHFVKHGMESYWHPDSFPIKVYIHSKDRIEFVQGMETAVNVWNNAIGVQVFEAKRMDFTETLPKDCGWVASIVVLDLENAGYWRGRYRPNSSEICHGQISIRPTVKDNNITKVFIHELGHSLGLAHDEGHKRSIMYPVVYTNYSQYIMPDDAHSVYNMVTGEFTPLPAGTRAELQLFIQGL